MPSGRKLLDDALVRRHDALAAVDDQKHEIGLVDRALYLLVEPERIFVEHQPTGIDPQHRPVLIEVRLGDVAIAGDAGLVMDDRLLATDQAVENGRLTDVGSANDGNGCSGSHRWRLDLPRGGE